MRFVANERWGSWLFVWLAVALLGVRTEAMPFTYQGRLVDEGVLANGNYELRFRLFDQLTAGTQVGGDLSRPAVVVTNGLFTVQLEFGPGVFTGAPRWLELAARPSGDAGALEIFDPRQPVTAVPYALFALSGTGDASTLTAGTLPDARLGPNIARTTDVLSVSNALVGRLAATNAALQTRLDSLTTAQLQQAATNVAQQTRLDSLATFQLQQTATNAAQQIRLDSLNTAQLQQAATNVAQQTRLDLLATFQLQQTATNAAQQIRLDSLTTAQLQQAATNVAQQTRLDSLATFQLQQTAANAAQQTRLDSLNTSLIAISNQFQTLLLPGLTVASTEAADPVLLAQGLTRIQTVEAPGWRNGSVPEEPSARTGHTSVWTGQSLIVWGGSIGGGLPLATGSTYDPTADQWHLLSTLDSPEARSGHTAVWTGQSLIVWGGFGSGFLGTGAEFSPAEPTWTDLSMLTSPTARDGHVAVWTGARMMVWGGRDSGGLLADGALYDPVAKLWSSLPIAGAPTARVGATAVWAGDQFLVWGGVGATTELDSGGRLPVTGGTAPGAWQPLEAGGAPTARSGHSALWTGQRMIIWGGQRGGLRLGDGASYDPVGRTWTTLPATQAPSPRTGHVAVWTGEEMLIVGGNSASGAEASGGAFNPTTGRWRTLSTAGSPTPRSQGTGAWTGTELLVFGGQASGNPLAALQRLNPQPTWYFYRKP